MNTTQILANDTMNPLGIIGNVTNHLFNSTMNSSITIEQCGQLCAQNTVVQLSNNVLWGILFLMLSIACFAASLWFDEITMTNKVFKFAGSLLGFIGAVFFIFIMI